jgi:hypothetical protein
VPVTMAQVEELVNALPEVAEGRSYGHRTWAVAGGKGFAWERPFSKADIKRFGQERIPRDPILAVRVEDLSEKEAVLQMGLKGFFDIEHFKGYPAVLIELRLATKRSVRDALEDGWLACAPPNLAEAYLHRS